MTQFGLWNSHEKAGCKTHVRHTSWHTCSKWKDVHAYVCKCMWFPSAFYVPAFGKSWKDLWDGSVDKDACCQVWGLVFDPQDSHGGKQSQLPQILWPPNVASPCEAMVSSKEVHLMLQGLLHLSCLLSSGSLLPKETKVLLHQSSELKLQNASIYFSVCFKNHWMLSAINPCTLSLSYCLLNLF